MHLLPCELKEAYLPGFVLSKKGFMDDVLQTIQAAEGIRKVSHGEVKNSILEGLPSPANLVKIVHIHSLSIKMTRAPGG
jgi:hypothetical protein